MGVVVRLLTGLAVTAVTAAVTSSVAFTVGIGVASRDCPDAMDLHRDVLSGDSKAAAKARAALNEAVSETLTGGKKHDIRV